MTITSGTIRGKIRGETRSKDNETIIEGMIEGSVDGFVKKIESGETGTIKGRIGKARIRGTVIKSVFNGIIIEGIIKGITDFGSEGNKTIERIIEKGNFKVEFKDIGEGIKFEKSIEVLFKDGNIEEYSHYNTFKICKIYVKNASESEYQLWPVIEDPNVS
jgi:hypothetical protein